MVELLGGADEEGGGLFPVEGAAGGVFAPLLLQGDAAMDDLHDVRAGEEFIDEVLGDH